MEDAPRVARPECATVTEAEKQGAVFDAPYFALNKKGEANGFSEDLLTKGVYDIQKKDRQTHPPLRGQDKTIIFKSELKQNRHDIAKIFYYKVHSEDTVRQMIQNRRDARKYEVYLNQKKRATARAEEVNDEMDVAKAMFDDVYSKRKEAVDRRAKTRVGKAEQEFELTKTRVDASIEVYKNKLSKGLYAKRGAEYKKLMSEKVKEEKKKNLTREVADEYYGEIEWKAPSGSSSAAQSSRSSVPSAQSGDDPSQKLSTPRKRPSEESPVKPKKPRTDDGDSDEDEDEDAPEEEQPEDDKMDEDKMDEDIQAVKELFDEVTEPEDNVATVEKLERGEDAETPTPAAAAAAAPSAPKRRGRKPKAQQ